MPKPFTSPLLAILAVFLAMPHDDVQAADHPNILWLVCEDSNVNWFGCYGNSEANTPNIDAFAKEGFRYTHAYASAPVCAASRSTWITGINAISMGTLPMRSRYPIPHDVIHYYPDYLRKAGYYTSNHTKTDYNIGGRPDTECWDDKVAHCWEKRKPGQPFFQVINFMESHESRAQGDVTHTKHSPGDVTLRRYHPDELKIRMNYAKYYDAIEQMDRKVGEELQALKAAGLEDDTIVIFNSDHGGVMPGSKRFLFDSGIHAPLIVRIPEKWKALWPAAHPGMTVDRLVSFLDMPKTWLSIAGAENPSLMQGHIFLGTKTEPEPTYVFSFRERMDERVDNERAVRDKHFVYIKNYLPFVPWGQHLEYLWKLVAMQSWEDAYKHHRTDQITGRFFESKPVEELYDMDKDPDNVENLAGNPAYQKTLETMRAQLRSWQLEVHDTAMLPEAERVRRADENHLTVYELAKNPKLYDLPAYLDTADLALGQEQANRPKLLQCLRSEDSGVRYWATVGLLMLGKGDAETVAAVKPLLHDPCTEVRAFAAWILLESGEVETAQKAFLELLEKKTSATVMVLNVLDWTHADLAPYASALSSLAAAKNEEMEFGMNGRYAERMLADLWIARGQPVPDAVQKVIEKQRKQDQIKDTR